MKSASVLLLSIALVAAPFASAAAPTAKTPRIGYVRSGNVSNDPYRESFVRGMRELGWVADRNIAFEFRYYGEDAGAIGSVMNDLLRAKVDVIVAGGTAAIRAAQAATSKVPIVMGAAADPLASGIIKSLARPGGNITGLSLLSAELTAKRLELLKEIMPSASRIAILKNPDNPAHSVIVKEIEPAARALGLALRIFEARRLDDFNPAFAAMRAWPSEAVIALDDAAFISMRVGLAAVAMHQQLPLVCGFREMAEAGCPLSYAVSLPDMYYRAAAYVDKILKGANPGDLPVEQGSKFQLVVNLKTAKAIGLAIPEAFLLRADEVIE